MRNNEKYDKETVKIAVEKAKSYSDVFRNLGLKINGGSYKWLKTLITRHNLDVSHFISPQELFVMTRVKAQRSHSIETYDTKELLCGDRIKANKLKAFLLHHNVPYICNVCKLSEWLGEPITLDIDHIDENCLNNKLVNLQFLCPNCHRQKTQSKSRGGR